MADDRAIPVQCFGAYLGAAVFGIARAGRAARCQNRRGWGGGWRFADAECGGRGAVGGGVAQEISYSKGQFADRVAVFAAIYGKTGAAGTGGLLFAPQLDGHDCAPLGFVCINSISLLILYPVLILYPENPKNPHKNKYGRGLFKTNRLSLF